MWKYHLGIEENPSFLIYVCVGFVRNGLARQRLLGLNFLQSSLFGDPAVNRHSIVPLIIQNVVFVLSVVHPYVLLMMALMKW